ncbi:MAG TPA: type II CAAX endopeptidase family protein [Silvibacterium sp.]|nr:type II CAAX endopeptidase family protein [Silvibacterium sp.]
MQETKSARSWWSRIPVSIRAVVSGLLIGLIAANIWPLFLFRFSVPLAATLEIFFLVLYIWWAAGGGSPRKTQSARAWSFRRGRFSPRQWFWGILAAILFAVTIHASIVFLFRIIPFPAAAFRRGYNLSFIPTLPLRWIAVVISALSAGICEETGFRGYMQRPIEQRHGTAVAILVSSLFFTAVHMSKGWALLAMVPIVFGAGILLGLLAWASQSLIPGFIGHTIMDVGLFAYWWTDTAGTFNQQTIGVTGLDLHFAITCAVLIAALTGVLFSISQLRRLSPLPRVAVSL